MRCPKCGYISFDRVERCGKCANDLMAVAAQLRGPMGKVAAPMFLGGLLREAVAEGPAEFDLSEAEELDLGGLGEEEGEVVVALAAEEEAPVAEEEVVDEEVAIEMPSLSGLDVSDLMPPQDEAALADLAPEEEEEGIPMPELALEAEEAAPAPPPEVHAPEVMEPAAPQSAAPQPAAETDEELSLNFDLTGGESRGGEEPELDLAEEAGGGILDLADLLGTGSDDAPAPAEPELEPGGSEDLSLFLDDEPAAPPQQLSLSLESADESAPAAEAVPEESTPNHPDIPDLGLTLESDGEDEPAA